MIVPEKDTVCPKYDAERIWKELNNTELHTYREISCYSCDHGYFSHLSSSEYSIEDLVETIESQSVFGLALSSTLLLYSLIASI